MRQTIAVITLTVFYCGLAVGQTIQVNRENRTISVTADDSVSASPDIAIVKIAYRNFGTSKDAVYSENLRVAELIVKAFDSAGVPKGSVETETLAFGRKNEDSRRMNREPQFEARQSWKLRLSARQVQSTVDMAMRAGANEIEDIEWQVSDPVSLQAKAGEAALAKARRIAEQMAQGLGTKLGQLVFASNRAEVFGLGYIGNTETATLAPPPPPPAPPHLTLYPKKVTESATVHAVFAIE